MTIEWLDESDDPEPMYAGYIGRGLTWLARADDAEKDGISHFVASTGTVDRMGDVVEQSTWKLAAFRANPVILANHDHGLVVGRAERVGRTKGEAGATELRISIRWDDSPENAAGRLIAHQHRNGFRRAVSVGFLPGEAINRTDLPTDHDFYVDGRETIRWMAGYLFRHNELLETSSVSVPANREALQLSVDASKAADPVKFFLRESTDRTTADALYDAAKDKSSRFHGLLVSMILSAKPTEAPEPQKSQGLPWLRS